MSHSAIQAVEQYYGLINQKNWPEVAGMFDLPAVLLIGSRKIWLDKLDAVTALYRGLGEKFAQEGAVRLSWDRGSFVVFQAHDNLVVVKTVVTREAPDHRPIRTWNWLLHHASGGTGLAIHPGDVGRRQQCQSCFSHVVR